VSEPDNLIQAPVTRGQTVRIDRLVLLAGAVRSSDLARGTGRGVLDLPIASNRTLLGEWCGQASRVAAIAGRPTLEVEVVLDPESDPPGDACATDRVSLTIRRDETSYRGTGGALRDIAAGMDGDGVLLVANAGQILTTGLDELARRLASVRADVALVAHDDGTPSGLTLLQARVLDEVNPVGFVDLKEQLLPRLTDRFDVRAVRFDHATGRPVRTLESYIEALRAHADAQEQGVRGPFAERWGPTFGVAEAGAEVDPTARLHDSVVLSGGRVEAGAVLVRCVVGESGAVRRGQVVVDSVVSSAAPRGLGRSA